MPILFFRLPNTLSIITYKEGMLCTLTDSADPDLGQAAVRRLLVAEDLEQAMPSWSSCLFSCSFSAFGSSWEEAIMARRQNKQKTYAQMGISFFMA